MAAWKWLTDSTSFAKTMTTHYVWNALSKIPLILLEGHLMTYEAIPANNRSKKNMDRTINNSKMTIMTTEIAIMIRIDGHLIEYFT